MKVVVIKTIKLSGKDKSTGENKYEIINNKQVEGQSLEKFVNHLHVQGYVSIEIVKATDNSKECKETFTTYDNKIKAICKQYGIKNGMKTVADQSNEMEALKARIAELEADKAPIDKYLSMDDMTKAELKSYCEENEYDIDQTQTKAVIIEAIKEIEKED